MIVFTRWLVGICCLFVGTANGQTFTKEWQFVRYLTDSEAHDEALFVAQTIDRRTLTTPQLDSLTYLTGWIHYNTKSLDEASRALLAVSDTSAFYLKSQYFGAYCLVFQRKTDSAAVIMPRLPTPDSTFVELKAVQQAGLALLQRRYTRYDSLSRQFSYSSYALSDEETRLGTYRRGLGAQKRLSPVVAGLLSALVPGLGKVYARKPKQGIAAFLPVLTLGLLTWEGYRKDGPTSLRFLGFGSLFTVFYVGNVWGSTLAVKVRREEFNRMYDNKILFDMHIPLRNLLGR